jgi:tetrapyrrole methylase family protein/MazG family protein
MERLANLLKTIAYLRSPEGCPWDRAQTHISLQPHLMEECAEVLQAIDLGNPDDIAEELGDVLLQVLLHAQIASESHAFDFLTIAERLNEKLIRRHPHVFGDQSADSPEHALERWHAIKKEEKKQKGHDPEAESPLPPQLSALSYAMAYIHQQKKVGQRIPLVPIVSEDIQTPEDFSKALFELVQFADLKKWDPEGLLRRFVLDKMHLMKE